VRSCGPCSACCEVLEVRALDLPAWTRCPDQCEGGGCGIYETRPDSCRPYRCSWLNGELEDDERPDLVGVIVDEGLSQMFKPLWGDSARCVREVWPGASKSDQAAGLISRLARLGGDIFIKSPPTPGTVED